MQIGGRRVERLRKEFVIMFSVEKKKFWDLKNHSETPLFVGGCWKWSIKHTI